METALSPPIAAMHLFSSEAMHLKWIDINNGPLEELP